MAQKESLNNQQANHRAEQLEQFAISAALVMANSAAMSPQHRALLMAFKPLCAYYGIDVDGQLLASRIDSEGNGGDDKKGTPEARPAQSALVGAAFSSGAGLGDSTDRFALGGVQQASGAAAMDGGGGDSKNRERAPAPSQASAELQQSPSKGASSEAPVTLSSYIAAAAASLGIDTDRQGIETSLRMREALSIIVQQVQSSPALQQLDGTPVSMNPQTCIALNEIRAAAFEYVMCGIGTANMKAEAHMLVVPPSIKARLEGVRQFFVVMDPDDLARAANGESSTKETSLTLAA